MGQTKDQRAKAKAAGQATRSATAARKAEIAANPIDWDKQWASIDEYWRKINGYKQKPPRT